MKQIIIIFLPLIGGVCRGQKRDGRSGRGTAIMWTRADGDLHLAGRGGVGQILDVL